MARHQGTRERILDVALDLFVEEGYDKASLREIAESLDITKAALYYHFPSKADILTALHYRLHALMDGPLELLGDAPITVAALETFLNACLDKLGDAQKLILLHRNSAAALAEIHNKDHAGSHIELELEPGPAMSATLRSIVHAILHAPVEPTDGGPASSAPRRRRPRATKT